MTSKNEYIGTEKFYTMKSGLIYLETNNYYFFFFFKKVEVISLLEIRKKVKFLRGIPFSTKGNMVMKKAQ